MVIMNGSKPQNSTVHYIGEKEKKKTTIKPTDKEALFLEFTNKI